MAFDPIYLFYGAVFLGAVLLAEGFYFLFIDSKGRKNANRRMNMMAGGADISEVLSTLRRKPVSRWDGLGIFAEPLRWFEQLLTRSGVTLSMFRFFLLMVALSVVLGVIGVFVIQSLEVPKAFASMVAVVVAAIVLGFGLPLFVLVRMRISRIKRFTEQLPDTLDVMVRSLHAGHPVSAAMDLVTKEMPDPIGSEFGIAVDEMTYGHDLQTALENLGDRVGAPDFQYVVVSINIQHETGGNLAEVLTNLSSVIRARFRMFKKIRALSGEGRVSAWVLSILPILVFIGIMAGNPRFYTDVMGDPWFWPGIALAIFMLITGIFVMYRMVNFRV